MKYTQHNHTSHECTHHANHSHGGHDMGHRSAEIFLKRFWIVTFLLIPLLFANEMVMSSLGLEAYTLSKWLGFLIATVIFGFALIFFQHALHEIKAKKYGMMGGMMQGGGMIGGEQDSNERMGMGNMLSDADHGDDGIEWEDNMAMMNQASTENYQMGTTRYQHWCKKR